MLVMIVAAEKDKPTPKPKITWYPYWLAAVPESPDTVVISPTPSS
jgi:hypothetical protein